MSDCNLTEGISILDYIKQLERIEGEPIINATEYLNGMRDCEEGNKFNDGMGEDYQRGWNCAYQQIENRSREA